MKRIVLFGGGGFIGRYLMEALKITFGRDTLIQIIGRKRELNFPVDKNVSYISADMSDLQSVGAILDKCDVLVMLAFAFNPSTDMKSLVNYVDSTLIQNVNLLNYMVNTNVEKVIFISSGGAVYGNAKYLPIDENHPARPISPYGMSKLAIEEHCLMLNIVKKLPIIIVRPSNPFGPHQNTLKGQGFIAAAISNSFADCPIEIYGDENVRDYIYIQDLADGICQLIARGHIGEIYNIGTGVGKTGVEVITELNVILNKFHIRNLEYVILPKRTFDVDKNILDSKKIQNHLGWYPQTQFGEGLLKTIVWDQRSNR